VQAFISKRPNISTIRNDIPEYEHDQSGGLSLLRMLESIMMILTAREEIIANQGSVDNPLSNRQEFHHTIDRNIRYIKKHVPKDQKRVFAFAEIVQIISKNPSPRVFPRKRLRRAKILRRNPVLAGSAAEPQALGS
jgi:hypothetical protein